MLGFTGAGLDRADNLRLDPAAIERLASHPRARLVRLEGLDPVLDPQGRLVRDPVEGEAADLLFLGLDEGAPLFAPLARPVPGQRAWNVFRTLSLMEPRDAAIWGAARSLNEWHARHRHCAQCGVATSLYRAGWGRRCGACAAEHFPRVDPVVIMLAEHRGQVFVARQPQYPPGRYSALAGFVEPGESIEEAVARELHEEAGLEVDDVTYVASQPWPFPSSLMIACLARARSSEIRLDRTELEDGFWVERAGVAAALAGEEGAPFVAPPPFAIAHFLLRRWLKGEEE